jgi:hypothetical protein
MEWLEDCAVWGEVYEMTLELQDADSVQVPMDETWSLSCGVSRKFHGTDLVAEPVMTIADGVASGEIDTAEDGWEPGVYFYDFRLTDPDGKDIWTAPVRLTLQDRNALGS